MTRLAIVVATLVTSGCGLCWSLPPWSCPPDPQPTCHPEAPQDGGIDASVADAPSDAMGPDAMPRPPEPVSEACVASWDGPGCGRNDTQFEPNNGMVAARYLSCTMSGIEAVTGLADVDVYRTGDCDYGTIVATGPLMPWAQLDTGDGVRACVFPTCAKGATNVYACIETAPGVDATEGMPSVPGDLWNNDVGFRGCCRVGPGRITAKADCPRRSTTIDAFIWVEPADHDEARNGMKCYDYTLSFNASK